MIQPKQNRVLYIVGAGFSAPLGLPVMADFISRSKDLFFNNSKQFAYFEGVYGTIAELSAIKNTFISDLYNIEEILSLLEMDSFMKGEELSENFVRFLSDVVKNLLPPMVPHSGKVGQSNWHGFLLGENPLWRPYLLLMAAMLGLEARVNQSDSKLTWRRLPISDRYAIITLNYDTVIEAAFSYVTSIGFDGQAPVLEKKEYDPSWDKLQLAKLHGCANDGNIVPPTWRKGNNAVKDAWRLAYCLLRDANQIRIVGYSLPVSDSYIRYLLKTAIRSSPDLKAIDVLTYDTGDNTKQRYDEFVDFNRFRFISGKLEQLFRRFDDFLEPVARRANFKDPLRLNILEAAHRSLFEVEQ